MPATKRRFLKTSDSVNSNEPAPTLPDGTPHDSRVAKGMIYAKEGENLPQKKFFRQRAHINPLGTAQAYEYPVDPDRMQWASHFAEVFKGPHRDQYENDLKPEIADVGCGFGGLVVNLAPHYPQSLMVGMEIRPKVTEYVRLRILALRKRQERIANPALHNESADDVEALAEAAAAAGATTDGRAVSDVAIDDGSRDHDRDRTPYDVNINGEVPAGFQNISVLKTNAMKYLPCFFGKGQLSKLFFCFPDPQFKPSHHKRRIVNTPLLAEYAYALRPGGRLYTISDVEDLHNWMVAHAGNFPAFRRMSEEELEDDPAVKVMTYCTEESKKAAREGRNKHYAVFERVTDEEAMKRQQELTDGDWWKEVEIPYVYQPAPTQAKNLVAFQKSLEKKRLRSPTEEPAKESSEVETPTN